MKNLTRPLFIVSLILLCVVGYNIHATNNASFIEDVSHIPESERTMRKFAIDGTQFAMPAYYHGGGSPDKKKWIEPFNLKNILYYTRAKLTNVYNGECLRKVDGKCHREYQKDIKFHTTLMTLEEYKKPGVSKFPNPLKQLDNIQDIEQGYLESDVSQCKDAADYDYEPHNKIGDMCSYLFGYHDTNIIVITRFRTGFFPTDRLADIKKHVTAFLDTYRIDPPSGD